VFVNNQLMLSTTADPGEAKGKAGVITYKAVADFDEFQAYQP
jgi:hypothetical protein